MKIFEAVFLLVGGALVLVLLAYWVSSKYVDYMRKTDSDLTEWKQSRMQESMVTGIILVVLITLAAWL